jgi:hypothetical protein
MPISSLGARGRNCSFLRDFVLYRCSSRAFPAAAPFEVVEEAETVKGVVERSLALAGCKKRRLKRGGRIRGSARRRGRRAPAGEERRGRRPVARLAVAAAAAAAAAIFWVVTAGDGRETELWLWTVFFPFFFCYLCSCCMSFLILNTDFI